MTKLGIFNTWLHFAKNHRQRLFHDTKRNLIICEVNGYIVFAGNRKESEKEKVILKKV